MLPGESTPKWLRLLEKHLGWLAVPHIAILFVTMQALGFFAVMTDPVWTARLALVPEAVTQGREYWRLVTFLFLPLSTSPIWVIFTLWFLYFVINLIEQEWGAFKTTLYVLISILLTIAFSLAFGHLVLDVSDFESTLFLAAAALFPEMQVSLFFAIPVKVKWLAWLALAGIAWKFFRVDWMDRAFMLAIYSNCLLFFGPSLLNRARFAIRRNQFRRQMRSR